MAKVWVQLLQSKQISVAGDCRMKHPGDWVQVGKQLARRWIEEGAATTPESGLKATVAGPGEIGILVNGKRVNIPSYQCRPGDVVEVAQAAKAQLRIKGAAEAAESRGYPEWIEVDSKALKGTFKARPQRSELPSTINESLIVELYSK